MDFKVKLPSTKGLLRVSWDRKEIKPVNPKGNQSWIFTEKTDAELKLQYFDHLMRRPDLLEKILCWKSLQAGGERDNRGWDGWMALPTQWKWVGASSRIRWRTGKPGILQSMRSQSWTWLSDWTAITSTTASLPDILPIYPMASMCNKKLTLHCSGKSLAW